MELSEIAKKGLMNPKDRFKPYDPEEPELELMENGNFKQVGFNDIIQPVLHINHFHLEGEIIKSESELSSANEAFKKYDKQEGPFGNDFRCGFVTGYNMVIRLGKHYGRYEAFMEVMKFLREEHRIESPTDWLLEKINEEKENIDV